MAELPVKDRSARQVPEVAEVRLHPSGPQPVRARGVHDGQRGDAVAAGPGHVPQLAEVDALGKVAEHHGQAGRSAVGILHLPDARDTPAHGAVPVPNIAPNWRARTSASDSERSTTDTRVRRCASCATEAAAPGLSWPVTRMAGCVSGASPAFLMAVSPASCACRPLIPAERPPGSVTVSPRE